MPYEIRLQYVQEPAVRIKCLKIVKKIAAFPWAIVKELKRNKMDQLSLH